MKFRTFPDGGRGVVCESSDVRKFLKKSKFQNFSELFKVSSITRCISRILRRETTTRARAQNRALVRALYARYLCSRDALGLKAGRPSAARDDRVSFIQVRATLKLKLEIIIDRDSNMRAFTYDVCSNLGVSK